MKAVPEQRDKQPTKSLEERTIDVAKAISILSWLPRYPVEKPQFDFFCDSLARFIQTVDRRHWDDTDMDWNEKHALGWVNPLAWVVKQVGDTQQFFPPPIVWREIYCTHFPPLDKKRPADLYEVAKD